jgi:undecaprenyl-diphosphatase
MARVFSSGASFLLFTLALLFIQCLTVQFNVLDLSADEMHYWEWSKRLDLAYYSKGPVVAWAIWLSGLVFGDTPFGVRFPAILCETIFGIILYLYARTRIGPERALLLSVVMRLSPMFLSMGFAITTDPLVLLFWTVSLVFLERIVVQGRGAYWILLGISCGLAVLSKYTAIILPGSVFLYMLLSDRSHFGEKRLYLGALLFLLFLLPILFWNLQNGWVNLGHNAAHLAGESSGLKLNYLPELAFAQFGLFGPLFFGVLLYSLYLGFRQYLAGDRFSGLLTLIAALLLAVCIFVSLSKRVYANWPMPAAVTAIFLLIRLWPIYEKPFIEKALRISIPLHLFLALLIHLPLFGFTFGVPGKYLPTKKLYGWSELAAQLRGYPGQFILAENYDIASALAFYLKRPGELYVAPVGERRMNQYDLWGRAELHRRMGQSALIILKGASDASELMPYFSTIQPIKEVTITYSGSEIQRFKVFHGKGFSGGPFPLPAKR